MTTVAEQERHDEWHAQWTRFQDDERFLFEDWIRPFDLEHFRAKRVLEAGCGGGQHTAFMAPYAAQVTAVDLNTVDLAAERTKAFDNVDLIEADIATMSLGDRFDVVLSIGVVHHTDSPERTVANLKRHLAPGGTLIVWVYSEEGNWMVRRLVEPARAVFLRRLPRHALDWLSRGLTAAMYPPIHTVYRLPLRFLPYYEYFENFRRMSFERNTLNVFDKLNAPQTDFISRARAEAFVADLEDGLVLPYRGVSYSVTGRRSAEGA